MSFSVYQPSRRTVCARPDAFRSASVARCSSARSRASLRRCCLQSLKSLERDGLVSRKATPTVPVTVEYGITPSGETLSATVAALRIWAEGHIEQVLTAQQRYDAGGAA